MKLQRIYICVTMLSLGFYSCGKKKSKKDTASSSDTVSVSGQLALPANSSALMPDKMIVIPVTSEGSVGNINSLAIKSSDVSADGTYSVSLTKSSYAQLYENGSGGYGGSGSTGSNSDVSYVIGGFKAGQSTTLDGRWAEAEAMSFIGMPSGSDNFINFPVMDAATNDLQLGKTTITGSDAKSEHEVSSSYFTISDAALKQLATLSSPLKGVKNSYVNQNGYNTKPYFVWMGSKTPAMGNTFTTASDANAENMGYGIYFTAPSNAGPLLSTACRSISNTTDGYTLVPPSSITPNPDTNGTTYPATSLLNSQGNPGSVQAESSSPGRYSCAQGNSSPSIYIYGQDASASSSTVKVSGFNWGGTKGYAPPIAEGKWTLKYDGTTVGLFDLKSASVIDGNNKPKVFIPSVRTVAQSNGTITKLEVRFLLYNTSTSSYDVITDLTAFKKIASNLFIDLTVYGSTRKESHISIDIDSADANGVFSVDSSKLGSTTWTTIEILGSGGAFATGYDLYGYSMRTEFRN